MTIIRNPAVNYFILKNMKREIAMGNVHLLIENVRKTAEITQDTNVSPKTKKKERYRDGF